MSKKSDSKRYDYQQYEYDEMRGFSRDRYEEILDDVRGRVSRRKSRRAHKAKKADEAKKRRVLQEYFGFNSEDYGIEDSANSWDDFDTDDEFGEEE